MDMNEDFLNAEPKDLVEPVVIETAALKSEDLQSSFDCVLDASFSSNFQPPVTRPIGRPRGRRRGRPSWRASKANYFETRPSGYSAEESFPSTKSLQPNSHHEPEVPGVSQKFYQNEEISLKNEIVFSSEGVEEKEISIHFQEKENVFLTSEEVDKEVKNIVEELDMVGKGGEKGGEKKKLLEMMSVQFNASDVLLKNLGEGNGSKRGRRGGARIGRPPKRKSDPGLSVLQRSNLDIGSSITKVNPITHALKKVRKEKMDGNNMALPINVARIRRHTSDIHRSGSEKESGDDSNSLPDGSHNDGQFPIIKKVIGRPRKKLKLEKGAIDLDLSFMGPETSQSMDSIEFQDYSPKSLRGNKTLRRGRGRFNSFGRGRGRVGSLSPAIGRESPRSESSVDSGLSRQKSKGRQSSIDEYISDGSSSTATRGRGKHKSLNNSPQPSSYVKGLVGRRRGRKLIVKNFGRTSVEPLIQRQSTTPVTSEVEDIDETVDTVETVAPRKIGRPRKHEEISMVDSPGQITGSFTKTGKKKKKHFKGLKYSFVKKKKKPKLLKSHSSVPGMENTLDTESLASEDVDADSLDSSSQDLSRRLLLLPGELDPYDPSAEFDDSQSEKSIPLSLQQQRKAYQRKGKEEIDDDEDDRMQVYNRDEEEVDEDDDVEDSGVVNWRHYSQDIEDNPENEEYEDEEAMNALENEDDAENEEMEGDNEEEEEVANEDEELVENEEEGEEEEEEEEDLSRENEEYENEEILNDESNFVVEDELEEVYEEQHEEYEENDEGEENEEVNEENEQLNEENEEVNEKSLEVNEGNEEVNAEEYNHGDVDDEDEDGQEYEENESDGEDQDQVYEEEELEDQEEEEHGEEQEVVEPEETEQEEDQEEVEQQEEEEEQEEDEVEEEEEEEEEEEVREHGTEHEELSVEDEEGDMEEVEQEAGEQDVEEQEEIEHSATNLDETNEISEGDVDKKEGSQDIKDHDVDEMEEENEDENAGFVESEEHENVAEGFNYAEDDNLNMEEGSNHAEDKVEAETMSSEMEIDVAKATAVTSSISKKSETDGKEEKELSLPNGIKSDPGSIKKSGSISDTLETKFVDNISGRKSHGCKRKLEEVGHDCLNSDSCDSSDKGDGVRKSKRLSRHTGPHPLAIGAPTLNISKLEEANKLNDIQELNMADPSLTNVLCKCRVKENPRAVNLSGDVYCQAIDSFDGRMIGCCNTVSNYRFLRVSGKIPFMLLCAIHRQRIRRHNCCPGCGLFCTQGIFSECRWDKLGSRHYYHKLCGLLINGVSLCPHCGTDQPSQEIHLELKLSRKPVIYLKQHQEKKGFTSSARMSITKNPAAEPEPAPPEVDTPENPTLEIGNGKVISASKLPVGFDRQKLIEAINAIKMGKVINVKAAPKGIYWSCKQGDLEKLLHVLVKGLNPNAKVKEYGNQCGLHTASTHGCLAAIHVLVLAGASLDFTDSQLQTPLMIAILKGHNDIINYLIQVGACLNSKTQDGMTCLHLAAKSGNYLACQYILDSGRLTRHAINVQDEGGWTPLVWASENRCISVVKILLERGANPQICDVEQNTALHWAAFSGSTHICSMVLDRGCSLRSMNAIGDTPLHIAARQNHVEAVVLLLARGASMDIKNSKGQTPLDCAFPESDVFLQLTLNKDLREVLDDLGMTSERILSSDIAAGKETVPILCVNGVDKKGLPKDYVYVAENCEAFNVNIDRTIASLKWCECEDGCNTESCICSQLNFQCWYDPEGRLLADFNYADPPMIFECNRACGCNKLSCHNRVVQHGMTSHLQLFKTLEKGWAVRALKDIPKGSYVCEYVGEIITDLEADQREDDSYLFDLDNRDSETFCIDARQYGNVARFINHSCDPNLTPVKVFIDHQDLIFPRIAFFANRDIEADEELGFDYGEKFWIIKYKQFTCMCSSLKCKYSSETIKVTLENYNKKMQEHQLQQEKLITGLNPLHD